MLGRLTGRAPDSEDNLITMQTIVGQILIFRTSRAVILRTLESGAVSRTPVVDQAQMELFGAESRHPILDEIAAIESDEITPREALALVYRWQKTLED